MTRMRSKYRLAITNAETFEEVWGTFLSRLNFLVALGAFFLIVFGIAWLLIAFTPIRSYIPGYTQTELKGEIVENALRVDSLNREMELWTNYLSNLRVIFSGGKPSAYMGDLDSVIDMETVHFTRSEEDSLLRVQVERDMQLGSVGLLKGGHKAFELLPPLRGDISRGFDPSLQHYGVDIVSSPDAQISAVAEGTVLLTGYDREFGYMMVVQHQSGLASVYKHCKSLLKEQGAMVRGGEPVAIVGNSGELSSGPHLHFELWFEGHVLNPKNYILF